MICRAHGRSSDGTVGRQLKIFWRAGVSAIPVGRYGPLMTKSFTCGSVVMPGPPEPPPANDQSCGRIRSSYGPSCRRTKVAATLCCPAFTSTGSVRIGTAPRPSAPPAGPVSYSISATRSPLIERSMSSKREPDPETRSTSKTYSASAGNT